MKIYVGSMFEKNYKFSLNRHFNSFRGGRGRSEPKMGGGGYFENRSLFFRGLAVLRQVASQTKKKKISSFSNKYTVLRSLQELTERNIPKHDLLLSNTCV